MKKIWNIESRTICITWTFIILLSFYLYNVYNCVEVYCIMVTGYSKERIRYAKESVKNWREQTYMKKKLIIINQSKTSIIKDNNDDNILELYVNNKDKTLGHIRNIGINLVPPDKYWTTWDDDDWRGNNYLEEMIKHIGNNDFLMFTKRYEYNKNTGFVFESELKSGFSIFFAKQNIDLVYDDVNTLEDVQMKKYALQHLNVKIYVNDPILYIRLIHDENTSPYVNKQKGKLTNTTKNKIYFEKAVTDNVKADVREKISNYL